MNVVTLVGNICRDIEASVLSSGTSCAKFTVAVNRDYKDSEGNKITDFIPIEVFGKRAEFCQNYLSKGRLVAIEGELRIDKYQTQTGENRTFAKVNARNIKALDYKKNSDEGQAPMGQSQDFQPPGFQALDDEEIPF